MYILGPNRGGECKIKVFQMILYNNIVQCSDHKVQRLLSKTQTNLVYNQFITCNVQCTLHVQIKYSNHVQASLLRIYVDVLPKGYLRKHICIHKIRLAQVRYQKCFLKIFYTAFYTQHAIHQHITHTLYTPHYTHHSVMITTCLFLMQSEKRDYRLRR